MRRAYSAQASSAQPGSLALTARMLSLGTPRLLWFFSIDEANRLAAPDFLEVVEVAHRGMHDVHHHVAEIDQHPLARLLALDAVHARAELADALLHAVRQRSDLPVGVAARDHHALEHRWHPRGVEDDDVAALDVLERLDHGALLGADIHQLELVA